MGTEKERPSLAEERRSPAGGVMTASRRQALARLGFATAVAYAAPTILHLDRSAKAQILPSCEDPPGGGPPDPSCNGLNPLEGGMEMTGTGEEPTPPQ
jgi:hypothetical protein